jgi:hypothetical protein
MGGELSKLSETRWRYATGRRVYYVRQVKRPDEDRQEPGLYQVDGGRGSVCVVTAESIEQVVGDLSQGQLVIPPAESGPW